MAESTTGPRLGRIALVGGALVVLLGLVAFALLSGGEAPAPAASADHTDAAQVAQGREVYGQFCASCHGASLEGQPNWQEPKPDGTYPAPPHNSDGHTWHHPDEMIFQITKHGGAVAAPAGYKSAMPPFGTSLTDDQIWAVIAYLKSTWTSDIHKQRAQLNP